MEEHKVVNDGNGRKKFAIYYKIYNPVTEMWKFRVDYAKKITPKYNLFIFFINDLNERMLPFCYTICSQCGTLSLHYGRYSPDGSSKKNNSDKVVGLVLEDITFWFPRIAEIAAKEDDSSELYVKYRDEYYNRKDSKYNFSNIERSPEDE